MRLLWVLVVVGVVGGVAEEEGLWYENLLEEKWDKEAEHTVLLEECRRVGDESLCMEGFFFTATALEEVRNDGDLVVVLSLERSLYPNVTFEVSVSNHGLEEVVWAREEVTLQVNELRRVELRASDLSDETAYLIVKAQMDVPGMLVNKSIVKRIGEREAPSDLEVFVLTEESQYAPGDTVNYRSVVFDGNVDKTPKFAQVILSGVGSAEETRLPWVEVPQSGVVRGNFTFKEYTTIVASVTSDVTCDVAMATSLPHRIDEASQVFNSFMSLGWEEVSDVYFSQPKLKGRVTLTSWSGLPLEGSCNVTIQPYEESEFSKFTKQAAERNVPVGGAGGEFEFDVVEELGVVRRAAEEVTNLQWTAKCTELLSGSVEEETGLISLWRSLFTVDLLSVETQPLLPSGTNSSHPQSTVVLSFHVERRDGGSVEEEEPSKGFHVELLLSNGSSGKLLFSPHKFSLPIPQDGRVRLEIPASDLPPTPWNDRIRIQVGDAEELASLLGSPVQLSPDIHLTPIDPAQLIRRGDVVRFRVRSCVHYANVNAILSSSKAIYFSQKFYFSPQGDGMNEVIEFTIPQNVSRGTFNLLVYGLSTQQKNGYSASVEVHVNPREIKIVDIVDVDMSTTVTFSLEGLLANSVVSLQAAKFESLEGYADESEQEERPLRCHQRGYPPNRENRIQNGFPMNLDTSANFDVNIDTSYFATSSPVFFDVDMKTSANDSETFLVTRIFNRFKEFGTYVVSGATFNSKSGRLEFSNSQLLRILPPPVTLSVSVPSSVFLGETFEILGYVKNNLATSFEGSVTLQSSEKRVTKTNEKLVKVKPKSYTILKMHVTPLDFGDLVVSLTSNISSSLTATKKVGVNPPGQKLKATKFFLLDHRNESVKMMSSLTATSFDLPPNCTPFGAPVPFEYENDILGDISAFVQDGLLKTASGFPGVALSQLKILSCLAKFYRAKKYEAVPKKIVDSLEDVKRTFDDYKEDSSVSGIATNLLLGMTMPQAPYEYPLGTRLELLLSKLKSFQQTDGSFQKISSAKISSESEEASDEEEDEERKRQQRDGPVDNVGIIVDTALALSTIFHIHGFNIDEQNLTFAASDSKRGIDFLKKMTSGGQVNDNLPLSLVVFVISLWKDLDAPIFLRQLENTASRDSHGMFWTSKLNRKTTMSSLAPSVTATSYALMTYVNSKKLEEASEIARWLISHKNTNGFYASFEETAAVMESLSTYATFFASTKGEWPSLLKMTQECLTARNNISMGNDFSLEVLPENDGGILKLEICTKGETFRNHMIMEVSLPSGYLIEGRHELEGIGGYIFQPKFGDCEQLTAYRMIKVEGAHFLEGSVTYYDVKDPLTRSVVHF